MLRWMTGVSLSERKRNKWVRNILAIDDIAEVMRQNRLRWFGHVERRDELCWIKRIEMLQAHGDNDVVLHHTFPIFTRLGQCPIVSWDFAGAVSIFGPDALTVIHQ